MRPTFFRSRMAVAVLVAAAGIVMFGDWARAQSSTPAESARAKAEEWAFNLFEQVNRQPNQDKRVVTFQPMGISDVQLERRHRRRLYGWMLSALHRYGSLVDYTVINPMDSRHVAQALEQTDVQNASKVYMETLRKHSLAKLNLSCEGIPHGNRIKLECTALEIHTLKAWGRASAVFEMDWLGTPLAMEPALNAVAGEIVAGLRGSARVDKVEIVEIDTDSRSALTKSFERSLDVRVTRRLNTRRRRHGWRSVGGSAKEEASYRLKGGIERHEDKLVLRVFVYLKDKREDAVEEYIARTSVPKKLLEAGRVTPAQLVVEAARGEVVTEKHVLHEAVKAGDMARVKALLTGGADVNGRDGRFWTGLMHAASRGYTLVVELLLGAGADVGLRAVDGTTALYMAAGSGHLEIVRMLLEAGADTEVMGPRGRRAADAAKEGGYAKIVELLEGAETERALRAEAQKDDEAYARARKSDTPAGYRRYEEEHPEGRHRAAVRERLRELDEAAYGKARGLDTVEGWAEYRRAFPEGLHAKEAREREWELRERGLGLKHSELVLIQRALVSLGKDVGWVGGVFGVRTRRAIGEWQGEKGLAVTGYLTGDQARGLRAEGERAERERAERERRELASKVQQNLLSHYPFDGSADDSRGTNGRFDLKNTEYATNTNALFLNGNYEHRNNDSDGYRAVLDLTQFSRRQFTVSIDFFPIEVGLVFVGGTAYRWFQLYGGSDGVLYLTLNNQDYEKKFQYSASGEDAVLQKERWYNLICSFDLENRTVSAMLDGVPFREIALPKDFELEVEKDYGSEYDKKLTFTNYSFGGAFHGYVSNLRILSGPTYTEEMKAWYDIFVQPSVPTSPPRR